MHPIHKHGSGMRSAERYDAKEAYNKKLSSKARMHYLENDIADHKGMSMYEEGMSRQASPLNSAKSAGRGGHPSHMQPGAENAGKASGDEYWRVHQQTRHHRSAPKETEKAPSRKASPLNGFNSYTSDTHKHPHAKGTSRKSSPVNNVSYGDKSGKTGYIGEAKYDMKYNAVDDITQGKGKADYGMSRYKNNCEGISRKASPLNNEGHGGKEGHMHRSIKKKKGKLKPIVNKETKERLPNEQK